MFKNLLKVTIVLISLTYTKVESLNVFEFSLIGVGVGLVYDQYFDKSLVLKNNYQQKINVLSSYDNHFKKKIDQRSFDNLPIQQKLKIIDVMQSQ